MARPVCIVVSFEYPPVPVRSWDWLAYVDGREERGPQGWGSTREKAVSALLAELEEEEDDEPCLL